MKNKLTLYKGRAMLFPFLLCLFLTQSCRKETLLPSKGVNNLTIAEAKSYFEHNFQNTVNLKKQMSTNGSSSATISSNPIDGKQPMWDASILKKLSIQTDAVLVPMHKEGLYVHISEDRMVKFGYLNYMMMYKDKHDNIITEWVELKPSEKWVDAKFSRKYDGKIFVKDWDGKIKKIYSFGNTEPARVSGALNHKLNKIASINGSKMDTGNGDMLCTVTTTVTIKTEPKVCPCQGHTYEQFVAGFCPCPTPPSKGYTRTIAVEVEYDCALPPDGPDGPTGGTGNNNNGSGYSPIGNPGGGGPNPNDYTPLNCNPDPNYTIPTTPPPPGMEYVLPCSSIAIPTEGTPDPPLMHQHQKQQHNC
ncbi:hypothetical protein FA048_11695 [Pedobacter polaris]|uniref:Uncharacterized protein n=1 Tax=Pedobacter polaris TaxID=2571273 RepID=A0A4U1CTC6_9SPHI|nr:hypothetical protein [Pedobacter polaris]TKC10826.1 hypothetical protein FA048_11695 [Pedobacter polaris]